MPLSDQDISQCYDRYLREHDRYVKMAEVNRPGFRGGRLV